MAIIVLGAGATHGASFVQSKNPDRDARHRAMNVLRRGMQAKARVMVFDTLEEFAAVDRKLWDRK